MVHGHAHHGHAALNKRGLVDDFLNEFGGSDDDATQIKSKENDNSDTGDNGDNDNDDRKAPKVVYVTMPQTFDGPVGGYRTMDNSDSGDSGVGGAVGVGAPVQQTAASEQHATSAEAGVGGAVGVGAPVQQTRTKEPTKEPAAKATEEANHPAKESNKVPTAIEPPTATATGDHMTAITHAGSKPSAVHTTLQTAVATAATAATGLTNAAAGVNQAAATGSSTASTSTSKDSSSQGMSGGAKAGVAIGIIAGVIMIASLVLFWLHKKKQHQKMLAQDNEKSFGAPAAPAPPAPSEKPVPPPPPMTQSTTPSKPPQLNVRPITQFAPDLSMESNTGNAALAPASAAAAATATGAVATGTVSRNLTGNSITSPQTPPKSGGSQNPFNDPVDPFGNHAAVPSPPASSAASDASEIKGADIPIRDSGVLPGGSALGEAAAGAAIGVAVGETVSSGQERKDQPPSGHKFETRPASPAPTGPLPPSPAGSVNAGAVAVPGTPGSSGPPPSNVHRVQMDFTPSMEDELELRAGQLVRLLHEYDDGWALCIRMDRSQQGVAPRTCLSARPVKPRSRPSGSGPGLRGPPPMMGPNGRPKSPAGGPGRRPQSPRFYPQEGRPMSPARPAYAGPPRPPPQGRPMSPAQFPASRSMSPGPGFRPPPQRSMSPGPYGPPGLQKPSAPVSQRRRSNSASGIVGNFSRNGPPSSSPLAGLPPRSQTPDSMASRGPIDRKPVPGQAL
ncbi:predicted protein [Paecilomyces variotii No. 5]|uniref:SH3 domain-containing protein n=1 Tax=Byssochlamys spectabilis (strain No. 5 / NBRC 109023) TaxID=1356009 RepID=V5GFV5_BYSSN|nr:predicted protein [Paecilomyces variotii No. 5]